MCALRRSSHTVYDIKYHFVWIPKYRKQILVGEVAEYTKEVFRRIGEEYGLVIDTMDVEEDYVHIFLEALPKYSPVRVAQILKSISGREIFHRFPWFPYRIPVGEAAAMGRGAVGRRVFCSICGRPGDS